MVREKDYLGPTGAVRRQMYDVWVATGTGAGNGSANVFFFSLFAIISS